MELLPSEQDVERDALEYQLAEEYKKPEIHQETRHGLQITVYFIRESGLVSMALTEGGQTREFIVPGNQVSDAIAHPEVYAMEAGLPRQTRQRGAE